MAKQNKVVETTGSKINKQQVDKAKNLANVALTWVAKLVGAAFLIATSYGYVSGWLKTHQTNQQLPIAGGILCVSVALFLYTRKR